MKNDVACIAATIGSETPQSERLYDICGDLNVASRFGRGVGEESVCAAQIVHKFFQELKNRPKTVK